MKANALDAACHIKDSVFSFYLANNWLLLPLHSAREGQCTCHNSNCRSPAKHPLCRNGLKDGSRNPEQIADWWEAWPFANVGIVTGKESGIVVLDVDAKNDGFSSLEKLESQHGYLPHSLRVKTGGQGLHIYFHAPSIDLKNRAGILPGLDFRGEGGYVVAPPSSHISGGEYHFLNDETSLSEMPDWLQELISAPVANLIENSDGKILEGHRNQTLISISGFLLSKGLGVSVIKEVIAKINKTACVPPLDDDELITLAQSTATFKGPLRWQAPKSLPDTNDGCLPLKLEHLPKTLIPWASDITQRMQVPLEFVCGPLVIAAGSVIGRKAAIRPLIHDPWLVYPNLWGFLVAPPGSMKSPAIAEALKALENLS
ncbi:MAG TPA: bifunctional DNA primase/polymerase, partial [Myxococcota bacterium]|nr:bifunctional DNA primase/polymerase [Myxococcota bacterium]